MIRNVISVIDGAAGSCGKAKVVGELATDPSIKIGASVTNCMPNAGHTFVDENGNKTIFRNIPVAAVNPNTELFIGPGSAMDMDVFKEEYYNVEKYLGDRKIYVHELVPLITERHKEYEKNNIKSGSTFKGCGAVTQEKVIRDTNLEFFKTYKNAVCCSNDEWMARLYKHLDRRSEYVILEGAQGCDLDLNHSSNYPHVTSRNVSTAQLLADSGISPQRLLETIMVIRPFPIRISNVTKSGDWIYTGAYGKSDELTWTQINLASMYGGYPCNGDVLLYESNIDYQYVKYLFKKCPQIYLKQLFGKDYELTNYFNLTLLQILELERLVYKSRGIKVYSTAFLKLPNFEDYPKNTIIDLSEQTTVTKMERRVFDLDIQKLKNNCNINTPYCLYLNFFQHLDYYSSNLSGNFDDMYFNKYIYNYLDWIESETGVPVVALGTGAKNGDRIIKKNLIRSRSKN